MKQRRHIEAVVIGASTGGVEALMRLLEALPPDFPCPLLIVLHLPADRPSALPQLLAKHCPIKVKEAEDKEDVQAGTVYIGAPGYHLLVEPDRCLAFSVDEPQHYSRPSIDVLFESAAYAYRESLLGIVLTGASADGADGLATVRALGGLAWVQDPQEASAGLMPAAAIERAGADAVLPLEDIASRLSIIRNGYVDNK